MSIEESKAVASRLVGAFNDKDLDALDELLSPDFVDHTPGPGQAPGIRGLKEAWARIHSAYPWVRAVVEDTVAEGDLVAHRLTLWGMGGRDEGDTVMIEMIRVADGKATDLWNLIGPA